MPAKELGRIKRVFVGREDHGILSFSITLDFGGTGQSFGGWTLDTYDKAKGRRVGSAAGADLLLRLLDLFEVDELKKAEGQVVYAIRDSDGWNARIIGLERTPFDGGKKFLIADWQAEWFPAQAKE